MGRSIRRLSTALLRQKRRTRDCRLLFGRWLLPIAATLLAAASSPGSAQQREVTVLRATGVVNPVMSDYIRRGIADASARRSAAVVIQLDTPGGLDTSMREIVQTILASDVPIVVYVSPSGARAASAGTFITYAAHVAAMAPGTNIGSAHPVMEGGGDLSPTMEAKVTNDAVALIRGLAQQRGRNAQWAEAAVRQSVNVTADEALRLRVVDAVAPTLDQLLAQSDGRRVTVAGSPVTLQVAGAGVRFVEGSAVEQVLKALADPTIAYLLLSLGMLALYFELAHPGAVVPAVVGGLSLVLAFYGLGALPLNYAGLALIILGFVLMIADVWVPTTGVLTAGGFISFAAGSALLLNAGGPSYARIALPVLLGTILTVGALLGASVALVLRTRHRRPSTGRGSLVGRVAVSRTELAPRGMVFVDGALWEAHNDGPPVPAGSQVVVTDVEGLTLRVAPTAGTPREQPAP